VCSLSGSAPTTGSTSSLFRCCRGSATCVAVWPAFRRLPNRPSKFVSIFVDLRENIAFSSANCAATVLIDVSDSCFHCGDRQCRRIIPLYSAHPTYSTSSNVVVSSDVSSITGAVVDDGAFMTEAALGFADSLIRVTTDLLLTTGMRLFAPVAG